MRATKLLVAALLAFSAQSVFAVPLTFDWTDGTSALSWELDSNPVPNSVSVTTFDVAGVVVAFDGVDTPTIAIRFFSASVGGGFSIGSAAFGLFPNVFGPQLFSGTLSVPVFLQGTFDLTKSGGDSSMTIAVAAVPEPSTLGLLGAGLLGFFMRRKRVA